MIKNLCSFKTVDIPNGFPGPLTVVVSGLPRGGITFTTRILRNLGLQVSHNEVFGFGGVQVPTSAIEVSGFSWPYLESARSLNVKVIHLLRDPVRVADSWLKDYPESFRGLKGWAGGAPWAIALSKVLEWNLRIEKSADDHFKVEDPVDGLRKVGKLLGKNWSDDEIITAVSKARNPSVSFVTVCRNNIPPSLRGFMNKYGYA